jgi:hypothetical protein
VGWGHGHPNERFVQFAYGGRRRNHKHCQPARGPPCYLRDWTRRERLPGLPNLGADQCGVPGCDRRWNSNSNSNPNSNTYSNCHSYCNSYDNINTKANTDTKVIADS